MFFKNLYNNREILYQLTLRQIKARYKQSVLGIFWVILKPLFMMIIFTIIFSKMVKVPTDGIPYPIFSYCALLPWQFFSSAFSTATSSLVGSSNLIQQIYFPREIFPLSSIIASLFDFLIASTIFITFLIYYKINITFISFYAILLFMIQGLLIIGLSLFGSALNVFYRDVGHALQFIIQIWMYATPIIYPLSIVPEKILPVYLLNPMAGIIDGYRKVIIQGLSPNWTYIGISASVTLLCLFFSYKYFRKVEMKFADLI